MAKTNSFIRRKSIYIIILIGLIALAGLNFLGWFFLQGLKSDLTDSFKQQFLHIGQVSVKLVNGNDIEKLIPGMENSTIGLFYQQLLYELKLNNDLENILLLDPSGRLLVDYRLNYQIGDTLFTFPLQRELLLQASIGRVPDPILIKSSDQYFLSAYFPVLNDYEEPVAVLVIDAPLKFFSTLQKFEKGTLYIGAGGLAILIIFSIIIIVATRRLFSAEDKMKEQERLAQLGQMAASVAHEIRNPLSIMKTSAEVLQKKYSDKADEMFNFIPEEINRLNRLVDDFLQFSRQRPLNLKKLSIEETIVDFIKPIPDQRLNVELEDGLPNIRVDPDSLKQVLLNLINNARDASADDQPVYLKIFRESSHSNTIKIEVTDSGKGISSDIISNVFDPFYSTKASGSGLGLTISRQLIERMGGKIDIQSQEGRGTTVTILLPGN